MSSTPKSSPAATWDERYAGPEFAFGTEPNAFLAAERGRFKPGMKVIVPGDGEGRNGVFLAGLGCDVTTLELSRVGIAKAKGLAAERGVRLNALLADAVRWDYPAAAYDAAAVIYVHFGPKLRIPFHNRVITALKPGGLFLLEAYTPRQLAHRASGSVGGPQDLDMLYEPETIRGELSGLDIERLEEIETTLSEGARHTGRSSIVRLIGRKKG